MRIKYLLIGLCFLTAFADTSARAADEKFLSCGAGYILVEKAKADGIDMSECAKLWCRDLELAKDMGQTNSALPGYKSTGNAIELCDADNNCVSCFGDRKWCAGEVAGVWNPGFGAYTRGGGDVSTYQSYQKGDCFAWKLEKPTCADGKIAILQNGEWVCATSSGTTESSRESSIRRTGAIKKLR